MAPRINLLADLAAGNGADRANKTRQRVYLAILIISGLVGAGAAVELLAGPHSKAPG